MSSTRHVTQMGTVFERERNPDDCPSCGYRLQHQGYDWKCPVCGLIQKGFKVKDNYKPFQPGLFDKGAGD